MKRRAILIGCSHYDDADIGSLNFANEDAINFSVALKNYCGFSDDDIALLLNPPSGKSQATRSNIIKELSSSRTPRSLDLLVVFFSGHGIRSVVDGQDYLLPTDAVIENPEATGVSLNMIWLSIEKVKPLCTVLIIDACRNIFRGGKSIDLLAENYFDPSGVEYPGIGAIFSCAPLQRSYELPALRSGAFTYALIEALGDKGRCSTLREIDSYLNRRLPILAHEHERPVQCVYSRVDPISIADVSLISAERRISLLTSIKIGKEIRSRKTSPKVDLPKAVAEKVILAFDFGTSYSVAAYMDSGGKIQYVKDSGGKTIVPSIISFLPNFDYIVGRDLSSDSHGGGDEYFVVANFKRLIKLNEAVKIHGTEISPISLASLLIMSLKRNFEEQTGLSISSALAAVPADFGIAATNRVAQAFRDAGLPWIRLIAEPCAAVLNLYKLQQLFPNSEDKIDVTKRILVVDVGGGTTDISVVEGVRFNVDDKEEWQFEVITACGDNFLGGTDYDNAIFQLIKKKCVDLSSGIQNFDEIRWKSMQPEAERAKRQFQNHDVVYVLLPYRETDEGFENAEIEIYRSEFMSVSQHLTFRIKSLIIQAIRDALIVVEDLDCVLLAGQGCKIHPVREVIREITAPVPLIEKFQENAVVSGLAIQSSVLSNVNTDVLLLDVLHRGIGVASLPQRLDEGSSDDINWPSISTNPSENNEIYRIVEPHTTIPTKFSMRAKIIGEISDTFSLKLYELSKSDSPSEIIGYVTIPPGTSDDIEITVDVDGDSIIFFSVHDCGFDEKKLITACIINKQETSRTDYYLESGFVWLN